MPCERPGGTACDSPCRRTSDNQPREKPDGGAFVVAGPTQPVTPPPPAAAEPLVLIVPNFSEGRETKVMDAIVTAMTSVPGVTLLNRQSDPDHNRLDTTLIGSPTPARPRRWRAPPRRSSSSTWSSTRSHPRMGAVDVIPFIPIRG